MPIPFWKRWLSYIYEVHVESTHSTYNESLHVSIVHGRYQLSTPTAIYSWGDKYDNFKQVFSAMRLDQLDIQEVLVLGLGLGSIPYMLEQMGYDYHYTGVEIDEEVIYLSSKYVVSELKSDIDLIHADASSFVVLNTMVYDMITMDVFIGHEVPEVFLSGNYLRALESCLSPTGILIFNMLARSPGDVDVVMGYYQQCFSNVFRDATYMQVRGNLMLLSRSDVLHAS